MDPKHLILNLPYGFYDYLEHSVEEWVYDYSLADSIPDGTGQDESMDLLAAAVPVRVVEWYQKLIRMVGWKLSAMAPASSAISNLIMSDQGKQDVRRSNCCVMDCGRQGVRLYFYQKGLLFAKRGLEFCDTEERLLFELEKIWIIIRPAIRDIFGTDLCYWRKTGVPYWRLQSRNSWKQNAVTGQSTG